MVGSRSSVPRTLRYVLVALSVGVPWGPLTAQGEGVISLPRIEGPVRIDGTVDEAAWERIPPVRLTTHTPVFGRPPSEATTIRIAYDSDYLYAAGVFLDSDPDGIRSNSLYRDRWAGDDAFTLFLDTFNSNESALWFETNPAGVRMDRTLSDDANEYDGSWNTFWDVATMRFREGWAAEMRIPLSSLPFQVDDGRVVMGVTIARLISRKNEWVTFPSIGPSWDIRQPSVAQDVVLEGVESRTPTYVTPYVLVGGDRQWRMAAGSAYEPDRTLVREVGVDLKRNLTPNLTLDLTVNTDFAQVEVDEQQINLTRFSLFYPEKRQFFQQRADVFAFNLREGGHLFYSRRIGLTEGGEPVRILGGARLVGRIGAWDVGLLNMQTAATPEVSTENLGAVRWRRRVLNELSYAGGMLTTRLNAEGDHNVGLGLDLALRPSPRDFIAVETVYTVDADSADVNPLERSQLHVRWQRRATRGLSFTTDVNRVGRDYRPDLGFADRTGFTWLQFFGEYDILPANSFLRRWGPGVLISADVRNGDQSVRQTRWLHWWNYEFPSGASGWIEGLYFRESVRTPFRIANAVDIPPGDYSYFIFNAHHSTAPGALFRFSTDVRVGSFYDGWRTSVTGDVTWNVSNHLELASSYALNALRFGGRGQEVDTHLALLRLRAAANAKASATIFAQYNSVSDRVSVNARLRYNFSEGRDLWIVYDEGINTDRKSLSDADPLLPWSDNRALRIKLTYTFVP
jgi:hypothetical protein